MRTSSPCFEALLPLVLLAALPVFAQGPPASGRITQFEALALPEISFYISVLDAAGKPVTDLSKTEIQIREDSVAAQLTDMTLVQLDEDSELANIHTVLVLDNSGSMQPVVRKARAAANRFIAQMRPEDQAALVDFGNESDAQTGRVKLPFTRIKHALQEGTSFDDFTNKTFLYDALGVACRTMTRKNALGRKAVVALSDGIDNGSRLGLDQIIAQAVRAEIPIYAIDFSRFGERQEALRTLAHETGGKYFSSSKPEELAKLFAAILEQLQWQYRVSYATPNRDWNRQQRALEVTVQRGATRCVFRRSFTLDFARISFMGLLYKEGRKEAEAQDYRDYLTRFPQSEFKDDVNFKLGVHYEERGFYEQALDIYEALAALPGGEWQDDVLFRKGKIYEDQGDYPRALEVFAHMLERFPEDQNAPAARLGLARSHQQLQQLAEAERNYQQLIADYPGSAVTDEALLELGELKLRGNEKEEAKKLWRTLVEKYKESDSVVHAYYQLGLLAEEEGDATSARAYYGRSAAATKDHSLAARALVKQGGLALARREWPLALQAYHAVIDSFAQGDFKDEAYYGLAQVHRATGETESMRQAYDRLKAMKANGESVSFDLHAINATGKLLAPNQPGEVLTLSGASLEVTPGNEMAFPVEVAIRSMPVPEHFKNFPFAGEVYDFTANVKRLPRPVRLALPYEEQWFADGAKNKNAMRLYTYENAQWQAIANSQIDEGRRVVVAEVNSLSLKAIMYEAPRVIRFEDILFAFGSADLSPRALSQLDTVLAILKNSQAIRLEIQGHTDSVGRASYNLELSHRRANSVRDHMITRGIAEERVLAQGFGAQHPLADNASEEGRTQNRRTEFIIISKGENDLIDVLQRQYGAKYTAQLGEFNFLARALEQRVLLNAYGFKVEVKELAGEGKKIYALWCGYFNTKAEAENLAGEVAAKFQNLKYTIVER